MHLLRLEETTGEAEGELSRSLHLLPDALLRKGRGKVSSEFSPAGQTMFWTATCTETGNFYLQQTKPFQGALAEAAARSCFQGYQRSSGLARQPK